MKEEKHAIITIGDSHFVVRIINFHHNLNDNIVTTILEDGTKLELSTENIIVVTGESKIINAILETASENFYQPKQNSKGKILMKKIALDNPLKIIKGGKNE